MKKMIKATLGVLAGLAVSTSCSAHSGHTVYASFSEGFMHPLTGIDHLVALICIGVFSAVSSERHPIKLVAFVSFALLAGFVTGTVWSHATSAEIVVSASMMILPICWLTRYFNGVTKSIVIAVIGLFSISHGLVQGAEAQGMLFQYGLGTMLASLLVLGLAMIVTKFVTLMVANSRLAI